MLMLKPWLRDQMERDLGSLVSSRKAVQFLYDESLGNGNADITLILKEALMCGDKPITEVLYESTDALLYLFFLKAILGLHPHKIMHLVALLKWLEIIPGNSEIGKSGDSRKRPKVE
jgi:hypothetical protein